MSETPAADLFSVASENWQKAIDRNDFHEAISAAIAGICTIENERMSRSPTAA
jgi:hypothetical protein